MANAHSMVVSILSVQFGGSKSVHAVVQPSPASSHRALPPAPTETAAPETIAAQPPAPTVRPPLMCPLVDLCKHFSGIHSIWKFLG